MNETRYMISDTAKKVDVETHVLRYWEEELDLSIGRTELGHRYYTGEDIRVFQDIKELKERGFQLKAIKVLLPELRKRESRNLDNIIDLQEKLDQKNAENHEPKMTQEETKDEVEHLKETPETLVLPENKESEKDAESHFEITVKEVETTVELKDSKDKLQQFEWIVQNIVKRTLQENNGELENRIANIVVREFDSHMKQQEEREEERYRRLDETIRNYQKNRQLVAATKERGTKKRKKWFKKI